MANTDKNRKSEAQERFEEADNAGRFAGNDQDAQEAKNNALRGDVRDTTGYDSRPIQNDSGDRGKPGDELTNASAHRGDANVQDFAGNADNVNAGEGRPLNDDELEHARNKANESKGVENSQ
jgi:hypothetical protein